MRNLATPKQKRVWHSAILLFPSARNATPASPARFAHRFLCSCMNRAKPRRAWADLASEALHFACKSMHAMHASLFTNRAGQKKGAERIKTGHKKAAVFSGHSG